MTAFDKRLYRVLETLAGDSDTVQISGRQLADLLDVSARTIRDSQHRLVIAGHITITQSDGWRDASLIMLNRRGDLTGVLGYPQPTGVGGTPKNPPLSIPTCETYGGETPEPEPESTPDVARYWFDELKAQMRDIGKQ